MENLRNQLVDMFNSLTPLKKIVMISLTLGLLLLILFFVLVSIIPKKIAPTAPLPIQVFYPSSSPAAKSFIPPSKAVLTPVISQFPNLSASFPVLTGGFIYYLSDGGTTFYKISLDGKEKIPLSDTLITQIKQVIWSPDKTSVILKIENNKYFLGKNNSPFFSQTDENLSLTNWYYNLADKSFKKLDSRIEPIAYSPDGSKLAYVKTGENNNLNTLYYSNIDGSNEQFIAILPEIIQDSLIFLDSENVLTYTTPHGYGKNYIYMTSLTTKATQKLTDDGFTFKANPSPKGNLVLVQTVKPDPDVFYRNFLSVVGVQDRKTTVLEIQTSPDLAAWSPDGNTIYAFETDKLWIIDPVSLSKKSINLPAQLLNLKIDEKSIMVSADNSAIFFTSNNKLYSFQLK